MGVFINYFVLISVLNMFSTSSAGISETPVEPIVILFKEGGNFTEGVFWDHVYQVLYFVDKDLFTIHRLDIFTNEEQVISLKRMPTFIIPTKDFNRRFITNQENSLIYLFWAYDFEGNYFAECHIVTVDYNCQRNNFNDARADAYGRIWSATNPKPDLDRDYPLNTASLYRVDTRAPGKAKADTVLRPVSFGNDLTWTKDNRIFYFTDSDTGCIASFSFDLVNGVLCDRETVFCFSDFDIPGSPDGLTIDWNGDLWIATNGAGLVIQQLVSDLKVLNVNPNTKSLLRSIPIPASLVTDVEFGGADMDILFVTTRNIGKSSEPLAGSIFQVTGLNVFGLRNNYAVMNSDCTPEFFN